MTFPRATARLQFHKDFTFDDALEVVDYYAQLGISHVYASPMFTARAGSTHGYDIVDPARINPELGGEDALRRFVARLREAGMGLIADIVPNHMGVGPENPWWQHMLEWGRESPYAGWFDIDWESHDEALREKVLAPFLGQPYGDALRSGDITLQFDDGTGKFFINYYSHRFPLAPSTYAHVLRMAGSVRLEPVIVAFELIAHTDTPLVRQTSADAAFLLLREIGSVVEGAADIEAALMCFSDAAQDGLDTLHQLLERQHYRLTWWRNAAEEINWRRFFEVSDLAGVRVEQEEVFEATHALIFRLYEEGLIDGVRVDHVDGLADPAGYCRKLRQRLTQLASRRPPNLAQTSPYIIVEKILAANERLRAEWEVDGATGYEFMDQVGALLHDPAGAEPLAALWKKLTNDTTDFETEVRNARRQLLAQNFVGEFDAATRVLHAIARVDMGTRDFSLPAIRRVLTELLVHFPVYRTYSGHDGHDGRHRRDQRDQRVFDLAAKSARQALRNADRPLLNLLSGWLGGDVPDKLERAELRDLCLRAITRFQQLTPPLAAKSVEDTAFYRYGRLLSRNEVGAHPARFAISVQDFHAANTERAQSTPNTLLATATHDHKRGEDVRARLAVLSELPQQWEQIVLRWVSMNAPLRTGIPDEDGGPPMYVPQRADELMLYQMLVGAWPLDLEVSDRAGVRAFAERIDQWQTKALREAKRTSNWVQPNDAYETACRNFLFTLLESEADNVFLNELAGWVQQLAPAGAVNSMTQTVLRLSSPGIPDLYQGTEFWDFSLVDPDNRRAVDHNARAQALLNGAPVAAKLEDWRSGHLKQRLIHQALSLRAREPELFARGEYLPLESEGSQAGNVIAFLRRYRDRYAITVATRMPAHIVASATPAISRETWKDTALVLPKDLPATWLDVFTENRKEGGSNRLHTADVLRDLPVALLYARTHPK